MQNPFVKEPIIINVVDRKLTPLYQVKCTGELIKTGANDPQSVGDINPFVEVDGEQAVTGGNRVVCTVSSNRATIGGEQAACAVGGEQAACAVGGEQAACAVGGEINPFELLAPSSTQTSLLSGLRQPDLRTADMAATGKKLKVVDVTIFPQDTILDLRRKLAKATHVPIYCQHIYTEEFEPLGYKLIADTPVSVNIVDTLPIVHDHRRHRLRSHLSATVSQMLTSDTVRKATIKADELVVEPDEILAENGIDGITVIQHEEQTLLEVAALHGNVLYLANLELWINDDEIEKCVDEGYRKLLYCGYIIKYWPMFTYDVWNSYVAERSGGRGLSAESMNSFPDLVSRPQYSGQTQKLFNSYNLDKRTHDFIRSGRVKLNVKSASISAVGSVHLNLRNLFDELVCSHVYPIIWMFWQTGNIKVLKLLRTADYKYESIYESIKHKLHTGLVIYIPNMGVTKRAKSATNVGAKRGGAEDNYLSTLVAGGYVSNNLAGGNNLVDNSASGGMDDDHEQSAGDVAGSTILISFTPTGYTISGTWQDDISLDSAVAILRKTAKPIIDLVNGLGRKVFNSQLRLAQIRSWMHLSSVELQLVWTQTVSQATYSAIADILESDVHDRLIEQYNGEWWYKKGVDYPTLVTEATNQYAFLSDLVAKEAYMLARRGLLTEFAHRTTNIAVTVHGLDQKDLSFWYSYILLVMQRAFITGERKLERQSLASGLVADRMAGLRSLKNRDPELFNPRGGKHMIYSRLCQKSHQPVAYNDIEVQSVYAEQAKLPAGKQQSVIKYWNFTTSEPTYYACPNTAYPHMTFITGKHPKGFCLPCCKKTESNDEVQQSCITDHTFDVKQSVESRYIMNYGRPINVGRLGKLPDAIEQYLLYHSLSIDATVVMPNRRGRPPIGTSTRTTHYIFGVDNTALGAIVDALGATRSTFLTQIYTALRGENHPAVDDLRAIYLRGEQRITSYDFDRLFLECSRFYGYQTIVIRDPPLTIERLHNNQEPIILIFSRVKASTIFGNTMEYYPIYQINNFAYFKDGSIDTKTFPLVEVGDGSDLGSNINAGQALAYRFAQIIYKLSSATETQFTLQYLLNKLANIDKLTVAGNPVWQISEQYISQSGVCYGAQIAKYIKGGKQDKHNMFSDGKTMASNDKKTMASGRAAKWSTYIPLHYQMGAQTGAKRQTSAMFDYKQVEDRASIELLFVALGGTTGPELKFGRNVVYKDQIIGAELLFKEQFVGYIYHKPIVNGNNDELMVVLKHSPNDINRDLVTVAARSPGKTLLREIATADRDSVVAEYNKRVVMPIMTYLDRERDNKLRSMFTIKHISQLLSILAEQSLEDDYNFIDSVLHSGYYSEQQKQILDDYIYQFDRKTLRKLGRVPREVKPVLAKVAIAAKVPKVLINKYLDVLVDDFCNPIKRGYFDRGIFAVGNVDIWRFVRHDSELLVVLGDQR